MPGSGRHIRIVEDDEPVRSSLAAVLESWGFGIEAFESGEAFLAADHAVGTDCVLLDVHLPGMDGLAVLSAFRAAGHGTPVIILTGHGDVTMAVEALRDGAQDFIEKPFDDEDLVRRIGAVIERGAVAEPPRDQYADVFARLTPRETDVMHEVVAGHPNKIIAHNLGLSPKTVEIHRARVMDKTGAKSLSHLVRMALKAGIDPEQEEENPAPDAPPV